MDLVKSLWRGDVTLWKTYWLFGVLGGLAFNLAFLYIQFNSIDFYAAPGAKFVVWTLIGCAFIYGIFMMFAIWRSAKKYTGPKTNAVLARVAVVIGVMTAVGSLGEVLAPEITEYSLRDEMTAMNVQLPAMIDDLTRLDRVSVDGLDVTYHYTLVDGTAAEYDSEAFRTGMMGVTLANTCSELRQYLQADVRFIYEYRGSDNGLVTTIQIAQRNCLAVWNLAAGSHRELRTTEIAARAQSAFVTIAVNSGQPNEAFGSGFIIASDGVIVTNLHVIEGANSIQITLPNGQTVDDVNVLGADELRDVLVLQVRASGLDALPLGDDFSTKVGEEIYVLGNPLGFDQTFSDGLISAIRTESGVVYFQISAPISGGSSGGPVLNMRGEVIGIASMTIPDAQNLNIAVPVRYVYRILSDALEPISFLDFMSTANFSYVSSSVGDRHAESTALLNEAPPEVAGLISDWKAWEQQVYLRLRANESSFATFGWTPYGDVLGLDYLEAGDQAELSTFLEAGEYIAAGVCDDDCMDLDLAAYDGSSRLLDSDEEADAEPLVAISASAAGEYSLEVSMFECETETCMYAVQIFAVN